MNQRCNTWGNGESHVIPEVTCSIFFNICQRVTFSYLFTHQLSTLLLTVYTFKTVAVFCVLELLLLSKCTFISTMSNSTHSNTINYNYAYITITFYAFSISQNNVVAFDIIIIQLLGANVCMWHFYNSFIIGTLKSTQSITAVTISY